MKFRRVFAVLLCLASAEAASSPADLQAALELARSAIAEGRKHGSHEYYDKAQTALAPWWQDQTPPDEVRILRATIRQAAHDFSMARSDLDAVIANKPDHFQARFSRAFIRMVVGDYRGAGEDCAALARARLVYEACKARLGALTGKTYESLKRLQTAVLLDRSDDSALRSFVLTILAEVKAASGDLAGAAAVYRQAAESSAISDAALVPYADILLAQGKPDDVLDLLAGHPESDAILLRKAIAAKRTGAAELTVWQGMLEDRFAADAAANITTHSREVARFQLDVTGNVRKALQAAQLNWVTQKEPVDAELLLVSALAAREPLAASGVAAFLRQNKTNDARLIPLLERVEGHASLETEP
jgi:thioredoxin-like negative regulator of GroEL